MTPEKWLDAVAYKTMADAKQMAVDFNNGVS